jgi:hypothetical protein
MDVLAQLYPNTSKDIQKLVIDTKEKLEQDWKALPYDEESKEKELCNDTWIKKTKVNEQQFGTKEGLSIMKESWKKC